MTLLYRESPGEDWERIPASDYEDEAELQRLLTRSPDVIPVEDLREGIGEISPNLVDWGWVARRRPLIRRSSFLPGFRL